MKKHIFTIQKRKAVYTKIKTKTHDELQFIDPLATSVKSTDARKIISLTKSPFKNFQYRIVVLRTKSDAMLQRNNNNKFNPKI